VLPTPASITGWTLALTGGGGALASGFVDLTDFALTTLAAFTFAVLGLLIFVAAFLVVMALSTGTVNKLSVPGVGEVVHCHIPSEIIQLCPAGALE
jgi:hypothetical protein